MPASELRAAGPRIRDLERALGRKALEVEVLRAAREEVERRPRGYGAYAK